MQVRQVRYKNLRSVVLSCNQNIVLIVSWESTLTLGSIDGHYSIRQGQRLNTETSQKS